MKPPFLLTQSRNLHNDSMWKKIKKLEVIPPYKIVVVRTCILKFLHSDPPEVKLPNFLDFLIKKLTLWMTYNFNGRQLFMAYNSNWRQHSCGFFKTMYRQLFFHLILFNLVFTQLFDHFNFNIIWYNFYKSRPLSRFKYDAPCV
jgi:hypothetical protein